MIYIIKYALCIRIILKNTIYRCYIRGAKVLVGFVLYLFSTRRYTPFSGLVKSPFSSGIGICNKIGISQFFIRMIFCPLYLFCSFFFFWYISATHYHRIIRCQHSFNITFAWIIRVSETSTRYILCTLD